MKPMRGEDIPRLLNELRDQYPQEVNILRLREGTGISHGSAQNAFDYEKYPKSRSIQDRIISWISGFYSDSIYDDQPYDLMARGDVHLKNGLWDEALANYEEGLAQVTDPELKLELQVKATQACISLRRSEQAESHIDQIDVNGSEYWRGRTLLLRGALDYAEGRWSDARTSLTEAVDILSKYNESSAVMNAIMRLIGITYYSGDLDGARRWVMQALGLASKTENAGRIACLYGHSAGIALWKNELEEAEHDIRKGLRLAEDIDNIDMASYLRVLNGQLYQQRGNPMEALNQFYLAWWYNEKCQSEDRNVWILSLMSEVRLAKGDTEQADTLSREALELAESLPSVRLPEALFARAQVLNDTDLAERAIDTAQELQQPIKTPPMEEWLANANG